MVFEQISGNDEWQDSALCYISFAVSSVLQFYWLFMDTLLKYLPIFSSR